jgi:hypothetical protein
LTSAAAAIFLSAFSVVFWKLSFAKPFPRRGMPDRSIPHTASTLVVVLFSGVNVINLLPVIGPSVIFIFTEN